MLAKVFNHYRNCSSVVAVLDVSEDRG